MSSMQNLSSIADFYKTDKYEHGYTKVYEKYFDNIRDQKLKILEIGIADGKSLLMWSDYFQNSTIIGIDIHKIDIQEKKLNRNNINFSCKRSNTSKFKFLFSFKRQRVRNEIL